MYVQLKITRALTILHKPVFDGLLQSVVPYSWDMVTGTWYIVQGT